MTTVNATLQIPDFGGSRFDSAAFLNAMEDGADALTAQLQSVLSSSPTVISQSPTLIVFSAAGQTGSFTGHFTDFPLTINSFQYNLPGGGSFGFAGSIVADQFGNLVGGLNITSINLITPSLRLQLAGSFGEDAFGNPFGSFTSVTVGAGGFLASLQGEFHQGAGGEVEGTITALRLSDNLGNSFAASGVNVSLADFDADVGSSGSMLAALDGQFSGDDQLTLDFSFGAEFDAGAGNDRITGGRGNDSLVGGTGNDTLNGAAGHDTLDGGLGIDSMAGGTGNDIYEVDGVSETVNEAAGAGTDLIRAAFSYALPVNVENLTLTGTDNIDGTGNALGNTLTGNSGVNVLAGGAGNDSYVIDSSDAVIEAAGQGFDVVRAGFSYTLAANFEGVVLAGAGDIDATGNAVDNALTGNSGANVLDGGGGNDTMAGAGGNDTYYVAEAGDVVVEAAGGGGDTVEAIRSFILPANVENLTLLAGSAAISATGNAQDNILQGNGNNNVLSGAAGNDVLQGGRGEDVMTGGTGNDIYYVNRGDGAGVVRLAPFEDQVIEALNAGTDTVRSGVYAYALEANVENLVLEGIARKGFGNALNNAMTGNGLANTLEGGAGNDTLSGGTGADRLTGGAGNDSFVFDNLDGKVDRITDFSTVDDTIQLSLAVFVGIGTIGNFDANAFVSNGAPVALDPNDRILYNTTTGALYYDADGDGGGVAVQFALLTGAPALTAADIGVIA